MVSSLSSSRHPLIVENCIGTLRTVTYQTVKAPSFSPLPLLSLYSFQNSLKHFKQHCPLHYLSTYLFPSSASLCRCSFLYHPSSSAFSSSFFSSLLLLLSFNLFSRYPSSSFHCKGQKASLPSSFLPTFEVSVVGRTND